MILHGAIRVRQRVHLVGAIIKPLTDFLPNLSPKLLIFMPKLDVEVIQGLLVPFSNVSANFLAFRND
jgi:hypothetical protein